MKKPIKGFKAYNNDMTCKGFKFEEGKTYETKEAKCCKTGFHLCTNPFDVLNYYSLTDSIFSEAEALGKIDKHDEDSKIATTKIKIGAKLSFGGFVNACVSFLLETTKRKDKSGDRAQLAASGNWAQLATSGDRAKLAASGDWAQLATSGDWAQLAASGDRAQLELNGKDSIGAIVGFEGKIKAKKGCWITLAEWKQNSEGRYVPICVRSAQIDGEKLKEDVWYQLVGGDFKEVSQ
jgi:hypothetical protein